MRRGDRSRLGCSGHLTTCMSTRRARSVARRWPAATRGSPTTTSGASSTRSAFLLPCTAWPAPPTRRRRSPRSLDFRSPPSWRPRRSTHKTELGAVRLNLASAAEVRAAFEDIVARTQRIVGADAVDGVVIQPMITGGVETLIGITHDPLFGPLVGFGIGGINVEVLGDVRFRVAPLTDRDADDLLHEIRGFPLLTGHRGRPPADIDALRDVLLRMSCLAEHVPEIAELDLNPVIALAPGAGCRVIDARIKVAIPAGQVRARMLSVQGFDSRFSTTPR